MIHASELSSKTLKLEGCKSKTQYPSRFALWTEIRVRRETKLMRNRDLSLDQRQMGEGFQPTNKFLDTNQNSPISDLELYYISTVTYCVLCGDCILYESSFRNTPKQNIPKPRN